MSLTWLLVVGLVVAFAYFFLKSQQKESREERISKERFVARFGATPRSSRAQKAVHKKLSQLSVLADQGNSEDRHEYEIALKIAKQFGFA